MRDLLRRTRTLFAAALAAGLVLSHAPAAEAQTMSFPTRLEMKSGQTQRLSDKLRGDQIQDYIFTVKAGQTLELHLEVVHPQFQVDLQPPNSIQAMVKLNRATPDWSGRLEENGIYSLRLWINGGAARRNEVIRYVLGATLHDPEPQKE